MHSSSVLPSLQPLSLLGESSALPISPKEPSALLGAGELCSNIRSQSTEDLPIHSDSHVLILVVLSP